MAHMSNQWHLITLQNFALTLTNVTSGDKVMGILVDRGPKESGIEDFSCCVVSTVMSTGGTIMASHENVESFLAVHTSPDHLIRTNFKQEGVIPKIMFNIFEKLVFLLGRHALHNESTRV
ncbi:hypothetical protein Tco_1180827, partial [Tanacetum coccineum]